MDDLHRTAIGRVVPNILGQLAFLFVDSDDPSEATGFSPNDEAYLAASLTFSGPVNGGMMTAFPLSLALELAANLLGSENDDPKAASHAHDSLGEFLNVACGHSLTAIHGAKQVFDLSAPRLFVLTAVEASALARKPGSLTYAVDGAPFLFQASFCNCCAPGEAPHA